MLQTFSRVVRAIVIGACFFRLVELSRKIFSQSWSDPSQRSV